MNNEHPLLVIVGPTGSGKTALSLALAAPLDAEIVSCDSVAIYRGFEIGAAKPSPAERARIPHHMIDVATAAESITAGEYARRARAVLTSIRQRNRLPIVVGGTGLYLRALIEGLFSGPPRSEALRARLQRAAATRSPGHLHRVLSRLDPEAAARIHPHDTPKLVRAIEVCLASGERISAMFRRGRDPLAGFRITRIGLDPDRSLLYERINARCQRMFDLGLVEETRQLQRLYAAEDITAIPSHPLNALGYRQAAQFLRGELSLSDAVRATQQAHRNYAKRQLTWFRNVDKTGTIWFPGFGDDPVIQSQALKLANTTI